MVSMICLNPVTDRDDSVKRGLFATDTNLLCKLKKQTFKEILLTDATTEDREDAVVEYFGVQKQWEKLLEQWYKEKKKSGLQAILRTIIFCQIIKSGGPCMVQLLQGYASSRSNSHRSCLF
jgi:hypothetical protein